MILLLGRSEEKGTSVRTNTGNLSLLHSASVRKDLFLLLVAVLR